MITTSKLIYNKLHLNNVKDIFMYSGGAIMPLIDHFHPNNNIYKINTYVSANEFCLASSAIGYAKSSNKPGICITTSGPGVTNCVTSLLDAQNDSTPLILLTGQVPLSAMGTRAFQEAPSTEITKSVTKWNYCIKDVNEVNDVMDYAFYIATTGKPGSVHIDIPKCILTSEINNNNQLNKYTTTYNSNDYLINTIKEVGYIINNSKKPIIIAGKGCNYASNELREFAKKGNIPVTTTLHGIGSFDETDDLSLKFCGMHGSYVSNISIQESDCIIALGSRFDDRTTGKISEYAPNAKNIIHVNIEYDELGMIVNSNYNILGNCKDIIPLLTNNINYNKRTEWFSRINKLKENGFLYETPNNNQINGQLLLETLNNNIKDRDDIIITTDVGNHQMWTAQYLTFKHPNRIITSGSLGVMGVGTSYAIGAKIANPDKTVIGILGDQSFNMSSNDLKTIMNYNLKIKLIIFNDSCQSMVNCWENLFFEGRETATNTENPYYHILSYAYDIKCINCKDAKNLDNCINEFLNYDKGSIILNVSLTNRKNDNTPNYCLPLVKPNHALDDMLLYKDNIIPMEGMAPN